MAIKGFSIYEVDGAWCGEEEEITDERTLVVRILLRRSIDERKESLQCKIMELGQDIAIVAPTEQEILICQYPQSGFNFNQ